MMNRARNLKHLVVFVAVYAFVILVGGIVFDVAPSFKETLLIAIAVVSAVAVSDSLAP
jgi:hypothetical protein